MPSLAHNKRGLHGYEILDKYEAGLVLFGAEVKSIKTGHCNLNGSYVSVRNNELWLINCHVSPYPSAAGQEPYPPNRERKLLLKRKETGELIGKLKAKGLTVLPISVYTKGSLIKLSIGVCRGQKAYDKRDKIKKRETDRDIQRLMRHKN
ncbi:MAG: SsrA-binding protein SmpB [Patescibacteria group bacterium]